MSDLAVDLDLIRRFGDRLKERCTHLRIILEASPLDESDAISTSNEIQFCIESMLAPLNDDRLNILIAEQEEYVDQANVVTPEEIKQDQERYRK